MELMLDEILLSVDYSDSLLYRKSIIFILRCARAGHGGLSFKLLKSCFVYPLSFFSNGLRKNVRRSILQMSGEQEGHIGLSLRVASRRPTATNYI